MGNGWGIILFFTLSICGLFIPRILRRLMSPESFQKDKVIVESGQQPSMTGVIIGLLILVTPAIAGVYGIIMDISKLIIIGGILLIGIMIIYLVNRRIKYLLVLIAAAIMGYFSQFNESIYGAVTFSVNAHWKGSVFLVCLAVIAQVILLLFRIVCIKFIRG